MTKCTYKDVVPYSTVERPFPVHSRLCGWSPSSEPSRAVLLLDVMYTTDPHHRSRFPTLWAAPFHLFLHGAHALFVCCHPSLPETTSLELPRLVEPYRLTVIYTRENSKEVHSGKVLLLWCTLYTCTLTEIVSDFLWRSHSSRKWSGPGGWKLFTPLVGIRWIHHIEEKDRTARFAARAIWEISD